MRPRLARRPSPGVSTTGRPGRHRGRGDVSDRDAFLRRPDHGRSPASADGGGTRIHRHRDDHGVTVDCHRARGAFRLVWLGARGREPGREIRLYLCTGCADRRDGHGHVLSVLRWSHGDHARRLGQLFLVRTATASAGEQGGQGNRSRHDEHKAPDGGNPATARPGSPPGPVTRRRPVSPQVPAFRKRGPGRVGHPSKRRSPSRRRRGPAGRRVEPEGPTWWRRKDHGRSLVMRPRRGRLRMRCDKCAV
jgi:hypothetical protein